METGKVIEIRKTFNSCEKKFTQKELFKIITKRDKDGDTKLILLVVKKHIDFSDFIIRQCVNPNLFDVQNNKVQSVLHVAVYLREKELVARFIPKGARIDLADCMGRNIFHLCAEHGYLDIFQVILETAIRSTNFNSLEQLLNSVDYDGYTPFHLGAKNENKDFCRYLSSLGVNVNATNPKNGNTVLHDVVLSNVYSNQMSFINFLIEECQVDVKIQNYFEMTAENVAQFNGKEKIANFLENVG